MRIEAATVIPDADFQGAIRGGDLNVERVCSAVADGVRGELIDGQNEVTDAVVGHPGCSSVHGDERTEPSQVANREAKRDRMPGGIGQRLLSDLAPAATERVTSLDIEVEENFGQWGICRINTEGKEDSPAAT